jgi:hypothetical protein
MQFCPVKFWVLHLGKCLNCQRIEYADHDHQTDDNQKDREAGYLGNRVLGVCAFCCSTGPSLVEGLLLDL